MAYDTSYLLDIIKKKAAVPQNQSLFDDAELLEIATDAIAEEILPDILRARQEYLVVYEDLATTQNATDEYPWIRIPYRAVGQTIIGVYETEDDSEVPPTFYWVENNKIYFDEDGTDTYRVRYHLRPGQLVETSAVGTITNIDRTTGTVTVSSRPSTFTSNVKYDFVRGKAGFDILAMDKTCTIPETVTDLSFTASDLPGELEIGDYVCISDQSPVPQVPIEWFPYLAHYTAAAVFESLGDMEAAKKAEAKLARLKKNCLDMIAPRISKKSKPIKTNY